MSQKDRTRQADSDEHSPDSHHRSEADADAGFPRFDREYETVQTINEHMMEARDEWEPPERPTYDETAESDAEPTIYTGVVRAFDTEPKIAANKDGREIKLGLDTGDDELKWVSIHDNGKRSLSNRFVRLCRAHDVNPESVQEFYTKEIEVMAASDKVCVPPYHRPLRAIWHVWRLNDRWRLWELQPKESAVYTKGRVPTWRFFPAYAAGGGALGAAIMFNHVNTSGVTGLLIHLALFGLLIVWALIAGWGIYAKLRHDVLPYLGQLIEYAWTTYSHRHG